MFTGRNMRKISHRGNISGRRPELENSQSYIREAVWQGYDVEVDVRWCPVRKQLFLGHDSCDYPVTIDLLRDYRNYLWVHVKDVRAALELANSDLRMFFHESERHTLIKNSDKIWTHDLSEATTCSIIPLLNEEAAQSADQYPFVAGICTDYPSIIC